MAKKSIVHTVHEQLEAYMNFEAGLVMRNVDPKAIRVFSAVAQGLFEGEKIKFNLDMILGLTSSEGVIVKVEQKYNEKASRDEIMVDCFDASEHKLKTFDLIKIKVTGSYPNYILRVWKKYKNIVIRPAEVGDTIVKTGYNNDKAVVVAIVDEVVWSVSSDGTLNNNLIDGNYVVLDVPKKTVVVEQLYTEIHLSHLNSGSLNIVDTPALRGTGWKSLTSEVHSQPIRPDYIRLITTLEYAIGKTKTNPEAKPAAKPSKPKPKNGLAKVKEQTKRDMTEERKNKAKQGNKK